MTPAGGEFLVRAASPAAVQTPEDLDQDLLGLREVANAFVDREVLPKLEQLDSPDYELSAALLRQAGELGLLSHSVPEEYGGLGLGKLAMGIVSEAVGRAGSYGVMHVNHAGIATLPIVYFGEPAIREEFLPRLASGEYIGAYCLTEPEAGSDALSVQTVARREGAGYRLTGTKQFVTNAGIADTFVVYAKVSGEQFTAFLLDKATPGLSLGPEEHKMGIRGSSTRQVRLTDAAVDADRVLGEVGRGHKVAFNALNFGRYSLASANFGGAKEALRAATGHATGRSQFGRTVASFGASRAALAAVAARAYAAQALVFRTGGCLDAALRGDAAARDDQDARLAEYAIECSVAKVFCTEALALAVDVGVQLHGGYGFIDEYPISRMYRDARIQRIFEGTNEINRINVLATAMRRRREGRLPLDDAWSVAQAGDDAVSAIRGVLQLIWRTAEERLGDRWIEEQEVSLPAAELAIWLYAAESASGRAERAERSGEIHRDLAALFLSEALGRCEAAAREACALMGRGDLAQDIIHTLSRFGDEQRLARLRRVSDAVCAIGGFPV